MARDLLWTVRRMFQNNSGSQYSIPRRRGDLDYDNRLKYMEIPILHEFFEIPLFALTTFINLVNSKKIENVEAIVTCLNTENRIPRYKTIDRAMRDILNETYDRSRLVRMDIGTGENRTFYYVTHGAVFDKDFIPIMLSTWQVRRQAFPSEYDDNGRWLYKYEFIKPIVHIDSQTFLWKEDQMKRFICNKLANVCLEDKVTYPNHFQTYDTHFIGHSTDATISVKIDIDEIPFTVFETDTPSISTTNKQLLQLAIDHIDEITQ